MVLICISLKINIDEHLFLCLLAICVFFGEMSIKVFCPFFDWIVFWLLSYMSCLYILLPLMVASFANIFSQSAGWLFILFMFSFTVQKFVSLIWSHLFFLFVCLFVCFYLYCPGRLTSENIGMIYVREFFLPMFFSGVLLYHVLYLGL